jgi:hypothetical protein
MNNLNFKRIAKNATFLQLKKTHKFINIWQQVSEVLLELGASVRSGG